MSVFDCLQSDCLPLKPDQEIIDYGRKIDRILNEISIFTKETMAQLVQAVEVSIASQEAILNNSLQYIRNIVDIQTNSISSILTSNRESISNMVSSILTELIIKLNVNGLPVGTENELSRPIVIENQVNNYGDTQNTSYNVVANGTGPSQYPIASIGANDNVSNQARPIGGSTEIASQDSTVRPNTGNIGSPQAVGSLSPGCNQGNVTTLVYPDGSQFYGLIANNLANFNQLAIVVLGPVGSAVGESNLALVNNLLGQSANLPQESLPEYINNQVIPSLAPVAPPLVQSPTGSLLPVGVSNPVDIKQPEAFRFQQRSQPWFRDSVAWAGQNLLDFYNSPTADEYLQQGIELRNKRNL